MEFNEDWKNLYFELKDLTKAYKEWCDELKKENLMLREKLNKLTYCCYQQNVKRLCRHY